MLQGSLQRVVHTLKRFAGSHQFNYQALYENLAQRAPDCNVVGEGDFEAIGRAELAELHEFGLQPHHALLDFGCGIGRLAQFTIPYLCAGEYVGIDIAPTAIKRARQLCSSIRSPCRVTWRVQADWKFDYPNNAFDMICAFSVFTHMEHEDVYQYLQSTRRIVKPGCRFLFTCLPIDTPLGAEIFLQSASQPLADRWNAVRNIVTSQELIVTVAQLAGWQVLTWRPSKVGQTLCVLQKPTTPHGLSTDKPHGFTAV